MPEFRRGNIVGRISYERDILFEIMDIYFAADGRQKAVLRGLDVRLCADSPIEDLQIISPLEMREYRKKFIKQNNEKLARMFERRRMFHPQLFRGESVDRSDFFEVSGKVLHVDGNPDYLRLCEEIYQQLKLQVVGVHVPEKEQPDRITDLLQLNQPDVLVLTGHDGFVKEKSDFADLDSYRNSKYFVEAVKKARRYQRNPDDLIIFAGACQSHYEALLKVGANFASSPKRVFIHAFDPVFIVEKICFTSASRIVSIDDVIENTITGIDGFGGVETRGKHRWGYPKSPY